MRYSISENTTLVGQLTPGSDVTIKLINIATDTLIPLTTNVCLESQHIPGLFLWNTSSIQPDTITGYTNILYEMRQSTEVYYGKFVTGGYIDANGNVDVSGIITDLTEVIDTLNIINARI